MIGRGVLGECLRDERVEQVLAVGRSPVGIEHPRLRELVQPDPSDLSVIAGQLPGYDACFFCLGVSAVGMNEQDYQRITYDLALTVGRTLAAANPDLTFVYISGVGTDSTERSRVMWRRVKGKTENALLALPFHAYMFRPGFVRPMNADSYTSRLYRTGYAITAPLIPLLARLAPNVINDSREIGRAMIAVATSGSDTRILTPRDITARAGT